MRRKGGEREDCADSAVEAKYDIDTTGISCTQRGIGIIKRKDGSMHNVLIIDYTEQIFNGLWKESILLEIKAVGTGDKKCGSCIMHGDTECDIEGQKMVFCSQIQAFVSKKRIACNLSLIHISEPTRPY